MELKRIFRITTYQGFTEAGGYRIGGSKDRTFIVRNDVLQPEPLSPIPCDNLFPDAPSLQEVLRSLNVTTGIAGLRIRPLADQNSPFGVELKIPQQDRNILVSIASRVPELWNNYLTPLRSGVFDLIQPNHWIDIRFTRPRNNIAAVTFKYERIDRTNYPIS